MNTSNLSLKLKYLSLHLNIWKLSEEPYSGSTPRHFALFDPERGYVGWKRSRSTTLDSAITQSFKDTKQIEKFWTTRQCIPKITPRKGVSILSLTRNSELLSCCCVFFFFSKLLRWLKHENHHSAEHIPTHKTVFLLLFHDKLISYGSQGPEQKHVGGDDDSQMANTSHTNFNPSAPLFHFYQPRSLGKDSRDAGLWEKLY